MLSRELFDFILSNKILPQGHIFILYSDVKEKRILKPNQTVYPLFFQMQLLTGNIQWMATEKGVNRNKSRLRIGCNTY